MGRRALQGKTWRVVADLKQTQFYFFSYTHYKFSGSKWSLNKKLKLTFVNNILVDLQTFLTTLFQSFNLAKIV